jgi:hypothetical protein
MATITTNAVIDFSRYVEERTHDFTGREWVFEQVDAWLARQDGPDTCC